MSLRKSVGNILRRGKRDKIPNPLEGVEIDYYFKSSRLGGKASTIISLSLWTVIVDNGGFVYCMYTHHIGEFYDWKEVIQDRMREHLIDVGLDKLQIKRMLREIEIKKDGHLIKTEYQHGGNRIGINGDDYIHLRRDRFTLLK